MKRLEQLITDLKFIRDNQKQIVINELRDLEPELEDFQVDQQRKGLRNDGNLIRPEYSNDDYATLKKTVFRSAAPKYTPDLKLTGAFQRGIYARVSSSGVEFSSSDKKTKKLTDKYQKIFGLNKEYLKAFKRNVLFPNLLDIYKKIVYK